MGGPFQFRTIISKAALEYWLTTLTLPRLENRTLAIRIWPATYGVLTLIATVWLAFVPCAVHDDTAPWLQALQI